MKQRKRSRIQFQPPFLVGALSALSLSVTACGALVTDGPADDSNDASSDGAGGTDSLDGAGGPGCPETVPTHGTSCTPEQVGLSCGQDGPCVGQQYATCGTDLLWRGSNFSCNPPPIESTVCPEEQPQPGESCYGLAPGLVCAVATCAGDPGYSCGEDGTWQFDYLACNPPPIGYGGADALGGASGAP